MDRPAENGMSSADAGLFEPLIDLADMDPGLIPCLCPSGYRLLVNKYGGYMAENDSVCEYGQYSTGLDIYFPGSPSGKITVSLPDVLAATFLDCPVVRTSRPVAHVNVHSPNYVEGQLNANQLTWDSVNRTRQFKSDELIPGEVWKTHDEMQVRVSTHNRYEKLNADGSGQGVMSFQHPRGKYYSIRHNGKKRLFHRMVLEAFAGPAPDKGMRVCDHIDGDTYNNHPLNLIWVTVSRNNANRVNTSNRFFDSVHQHDPDCECAKCKELADNLQLVPAVYYMF